MKLFNNPKKVVIVLVVFVLLFMSYKAFAAEVEIGPTFTGEFNGGMALNYMERFGPVDIGMTLVSDQTWEDGKYSVGNNGNVWLAFIAERPENWWVVLPSEMSIGPAVWIKEYPPIAGCRMGYTLGLKWRFGQFSIGARHWSNAGICEANRGQDLLTFGWRF